MVILLFYHILYKNVYQQYAFLNMGILWVEVVLLFFYPTPNFANT